MLSFARDEIGSNMEMVHYWPELRAAEGASAWGALAATAAMLSESILPQGQQVRAAGKRWTHRYRLEQKGHLKRTCRRRQGYCIGREKPQPLSLLVVSEVS